MQCSLCLVHSRHKDGLISIMSRIKIGVVAAFSHLKLLQSKALFAWLISKVKSVFGGETLKAVCLLNKSLGRITSQQHHFGLDCRYSPQPRTLE